MLGYHCEYESGDIKVNTDELTDAQWFDVGNLPNIPPKISISGRLIASYLEGHLRPSWCFLITFFFVSFELVLTSTGFEDFIFFLF